MSQNIALAKISGTRQLNIDHFRYRLLFFVNLYLFFRFLQKIAYNLLCMNPISRCLCLICSKNNWSPMKSTLKPTINHQKPRKKPPHQPVRRPQNHQIILCLPDYPANYSDKSQPANSSASFSSVASLSAFSADLIVTVVSVKVMFLDFSNMAFISLPATGAQVPF